MGLVNKIIFGIIKMLQGIAFKCSSSCCKCKSECMGNNNVCEHEEVKKHTGTEGDKNILDYCHKID